MRLRIEITPRLAAYLDALVEEGLYGSDRRQVIEALVCRGIEELIARGILDRART